MQIHQSRIDKWWNMGLEEIVVLPTEKVRLNEENKDGILDFFTPIGLINDIGKDGSYIKFFKDIGTQKFYTFEEFSKQKGEWEPTFSQLLLYQGIYCKGVGNLSSMIVLKFVQPRSDGRIVCIQRDFNFSNNIEYQFLGVKGDYSPFKALYVSQNFGIQHKSENIYIIRKLGDVELFEFKLNEPISIK